MILPLTALGTATQFFGVVPSACLPVSCLSNEKNSGEKNILFCFRCSPLKISSIRCRESWHGIAMVEHPSPSVRAEQPNFVADLTG